MDVELDQPAVWSRKCACGKSFYQPNSFSNHIRTCPRYKGEVGTTLENAKVKYAQKKFLKKGKEAIETWYTADSLDVDSELVAGEPMRDVEVRPVPLFPFLARGGDPPSAAAKSTPRRGGPSPRALRTWEAHTSSTERLQGLPSDIRDPV
jgi:hypothetical protein